VSRTTLVYAASLLAALLWPHVGAAGEIAGLPGNLPPIIEKPLEFNFSNDFLGRGGSVDDFRTQQFIISATIKERWVATLDHSILTLDDPDTPGRTDQLSASLGYRLFDQRNKTALNQLTAGIGLRSYGEFAGERIQNGFHRIIGSGVETHPYTDISQTDATAWVDAHRYALLRGSLGDAEEWRAGYWLRGSALLTTDGQTDAALGVYGGVGRRNVDAWLGLRQDWRSGYDAAVLAETAAAEQDIALVFGLRWGPVVFETVQQFDNHASYGQLRLIASGFGSEHGSSEQSDFAIDTGVLLPDVHVWFAGRHSSEWMNRSDSIWRRSVFVSTTFGEPQFENDPTLYIRSVQLGAGIEWERPLEGWRGWASVYGSIGAGAREERLIGDVDRRGQKSESVSRGVALLALGMRINAGELIANWNYRLQIGLTAWLPFSEAQVQIEADTYRLQRPTLALTLGMSLGRFSD
jgi:hypothetical protein